MNDRPITFEVLNAYVDGELDASAMADVAYAVSEDSDLARQVAAISRLHSVLAESLDAPPQSLPLTEAAAPPSQTLKRLTRSRSIIADYARPCRKPISRT